MFGDKTASGLSGVLDRWHRTCQNTISFRANSKPFEFNLNIVGIRAGKTGFSTEVEATSLVPIGLAPTEHEAKLMLSKHTAFAHLIYVSSQLYAGRCVSARPVVCAEAAAVNLGRSKLDLKRTWTKPS
jgi:hypothetical protein